MNGVEKSRVLYGATAEEWRRRRRSIEVHGHNQILRIRAEDSNLGEDIAVMHLMLFSKPILPASPLSATK